jgi:transposase
MGQAKDITLRLKVIAGRQQGATYEALATEHCLNLSTVYAWCLRWASSAEQGLVPHYKRCGRQVDPDSRKGFRLVRLTAHLHKEWGIPYIVSRIKLKYPDLPLQSVRHYQRLIRRDKKDEVSTVKMPRESPVDRAREPHDVWQIDAKERIALKSDEAKEACYLNITDEKTSAVLHAKAFSPGTNLSGSITKHSGFIT